jgi:archaellum component FlaC
MPYGWSYRSAKTPAYFRRVYMEDGDFRKIEDMFKHNVGVLSESFQRKLDIVIEGQQMLSEKVDRLDERLERLEGRVDRIEVKVDALSADLSVHRADNKAHQGFNG